ncbi:hypothetical protein PYW08_014258 [Mythimna loreyi]|uniref:Uncharacterized protein n=1 Tax=Mythimna loreyi TaxID=667449 RepID=A0ACC2R875_9NEOP|nr:hypothetical protein PYW08_014258 [Mythimna loreyi]
MPGGGNLVRAERFRKAPRTPRTSHARYYYTRSLVLDSPVKKRPHTPRIRLTCLTIATLWKMPAEQTLYSE